MKERNNATFLAPLVAGALSWVVACSWRGMVADPFRFTGPAFIAAVLVALTGIGGRLLRLRWYAVLPLQLVVVLVWFHHKQHADSLLGGWIPTPHGVARLIDQFRDGASAINTYAAPVPEQYTNAPAYLAAAAILVIVLVDLIACGLRQPAWAGLPVLVALTIPISVLDGGLPVVVYIGSGLLFALLLAVAEADRAIAWGQAVADRDKIDPDYQTVGITAMGGRALAIGGTATVMALVISLGGPVGDGLFRHHGDGEGGDGTGGTVTLTNPLADLRRDLKRNNHLPLLDVSTDAKDPSYVRTTVLDQFEDGAWIPSQRNLAETNVANGDLPAPIGVDPQQPGAESSWDLETSASFTTSWLPTPYPTRSIFIDKGDWRYDSNLLDIASVGKTIPSDVSYQLTAFAPRLTANELDGAAAPPLNITSAMTALPELPTVVTDIAKKVTAAGTTEYAKAVLLQDWFRSEGGFTYSLEQRKGGGLRQLAHFVTDDKIGYCEQFSAAMAIMARSLGIPARVVVGFLSPRETAPGKYRFTTDDLHAWPEIYFSGYGWVRFEPTPSARTGTAPRWTVGVPSRPGPGVSTPTATPSSRVKDPGPKKAPETVTSASADDSGAPTLLLTMSGLALLVLVLGVPRVLRSRQRSRRLRPREDPRAEIEALWAELRATAVDLGIEWPWDRSPRMVGDALSGQVLRPRRGDVVDPDRVALDHLVSLVERARYQDGFAPDAADRSSARETVRSWLALMPETVSTRRLRLAQFAPRSVLLRISAGQEAVAPAGNSLSGVGR